MRSLSRMQTRMLLFFSAILCFGLTGCLQTGKQTAQLELRVSSLERDLSQLEQALERERQTRRSEDEALQAHLDRLSSSGMQPAEGNATQEPEGSLELTSEDESDQNATAAETTQAAKLEEQAPAADSPGTVRQKYQQALDTLLSGNPMRSQKMFKQFIDEHPKSPLLPNAYYWLGESYYVQKQFAQSILAFKEVSNQFPDDPKAPDALLKMGYAYANLDQDANARFYLQTLIKEYPDSKSAKLAQKRLENL